MTNVVTRRFSFGSYEPKNLERRRSELGINTLGRELIDAWNSIETRLSVLDASLLLEDVQRFGISAEDYLRAFRANHTASPTSVLYELLVSKLKDLPATEFSTLYLHRGNPFAFNHQLLMSESLDELERLFANVANDVPWEANWLFPETGVREFLCEIAPALRPDQLSVWWQEFEQTSSSRSEMDVMRAKLLLVYELRARGRTLDQVYEMIRNHCTRNAQAALFYLDIQKCKLASLADSFEQKALKRNVPPSPDCDWKS